MTLTLGELIKEAAAESIAEDREHRGTKRHRNVLDRWRASRAQIMATRLGRDIEWFTDSHIEFCLAGWTHLHNNAECLAWWDALSQQDRQAFIDLHRAPVSEHSDGGINWAMFDRVVSSPCEIWSNQNPSFDCKAA